MPRYDIEVLYKTYFGRTESVEADSLEDACRLAINKANNSDNWNSTDYVGPTFVDVITVDAVAIRFPVPEKFKEPQ